MKKAILIILTFIFVGCSASEPKDVRINLNFEGTNLTYYVVSDKDNTYTRELFEFIEKKNGNTWEPVDPVIQIAWFDIVKDVYATQSDPNKIDLKGVYNITKGEYRLSYKSHLLNMS